jgi:hypothetical protein
MTSASVAPWREVEIDLVTRRAHVAPYVSLEVWADFACDGEVLRRPAFWDGGGVWRVRFAPPHAGDWHWVSGANVDDPGLRDRAGTVVCVGGDGGSGVRAFEHGFWRMSPSGRQLEHADGTPALMVADTAWSLPWRATPEQVEVYARDRQAKGFNAVLLMTVQPDMRAVGPRDRSLDEGFDVAFEDLPAGRLRELNADYFRRFDVLVDILVSHDLVPVLQPVFQGFGWKGLDVAGTVVPADEYARYCRYLVARYGARPAVYLVGGDGSGEEPQVAAGGEEVHAWDAYGQPTGIHYRPHATNRAHQGAEWLDFQSCQTGHEAEHLPERVADMWRNTPAKGVLNLEPTYENTRERGRAVGWWQGHEAWSNLCAGGTMGVGYGAASLWQWRLHAEEPGHPEGFLCPDAGWRDALAFEGSTYIGLVGHIIRHLPFGEMSPDWTSALGGRGLSVPGALLLLYREGAREVKLMERDLPPHLSVLDPRTGEVIGQSVLDPLTEVLDNPLGDPRLYVFTRHPVTWDATPARWRCPRTTSPSSSTSPAGRCPPSSTGGRPSATSSRETCPPWSRRASRSTAPTTSTSPAGWPSCPSSTAPGPAGPGCRDRVTAGAGAPGSPWSTPASTGGRSQEPVSTGPACSRWRRPTSTPSSPCTSRSSSKRPGWCECRPA